MKLWIVSDLHIGPGSSWAPSIPQHDVMVVAGDLAADYMDTLLQLYSLSRWSSAPVVFVPGNHDAFGKSIVAWDRRSDRLLEAGVHVLSSGQSIVIDGVRFVGATLWTDWLLGDKEWQAQAWAARHMPEFSHVTRSDGDLIWPIDLSNAHDLHRARIDAVLTQPHAGPTVVVTHHAPSEKSLHAGEARGEEAAAFASDLEPLIWSRQPVLWVHGHIHRAADYMIGGTRVVCNPRGYQAPEWSEKTGWTEDLVIEL